MSKEELTLRQKLSLIQTELVVPKTREMRGKTGKVMYKFRNLDDIFDSLKPVNASKGVFFTVDEEPVLCGNTIFRKAIASVTDTESDDTISAVSFVRENIDGGGIQSGEQKSGGSSSYASKLAMSKLLLLDDNSDPDEREFAEDGAKITQYKTPAGWKAWGSKTIKQLGEKTVKEIVTKLNAKPELTNDDKEFLTAVAK